MNPSVMTNIEPEFNWFDLVKANKSPVSGYERNSTYYKGDFILDETHGVGIVFSTFANKIDVLFEKETVELTHQLIF